jgi:alkylhydroperoxidase/carboxymuconolactone decarboxylase family protein YurZ
LASAVQHGTWEVFRNERVSAAYDDLGRTIGEAGPLNEKQAQLIKLGMAVASGQEGAVHSHARRALEAGAKAEEVRQVALLGMTTVGFPRMMAGLSWIDDVLKGGLGGKRKARRTR